MRFLIDAHLPRRLVYRFREVGHDAIHTLDLAQQNRTPDQEINALSIRESRIVVTKDEDFVDSFLTRRQPFKLLLVSTGNITNDELDRLLIDSIGQIADAFEIYSFVELDRRKLICHE